MLDKFPVLETKRLLCREITAADAPTLHRYWSDPVVMEFLSLAPFTKLEETQEMISLVNLMPAAGQGFRWAITRKQDEQVLGTCGFHNGKPEHSRFEMGYELGREYWRQGIMSEALRAILSFGFQTMKINRVEAFVNHGNVRSTGILAKLGFQLDGILREYEKNRGKYVNQYCFSLLKSDWEHVGTC